MAAVSGVPSVNIFQEARNRIRSDINKIIKCLSNKQIQMFAEIDGLEKEFKNKQQQQQKELNKLNSLKSQTEDLRENNLLTIQHKLIQEIEQEIDTLSIDSKLIPDYSINVLWGFSDRDLLHNINCSKIETVANGTESPIQEQSVYPVTTEDVLCFSEDYFEDSNTVSSLESLATNPTIQIPVRSHRRYTDVDTVDTNYGVINRIGRLYTTVQTKLSLDGENY